MFPVLHRSGLHYHDTSFYLEMLIAVQQGFMVDLNLHLLLNLINMISLELILAYLLRQKMCFGVHNSFFKKIPSNFDSYIDSF